MICNVTGTLRDLTGSVLANTKVTFYRKGVLAQDNSVVIPQMVEETSDGSGLIDINLYAGTYTAHTIGLNGKQEQFSVGVPEQANANLSDLINQSPPVTPTILSDAVDARDAAQAAQTGAEAAAGSAAATAASGVQTALEGIRDQAEDHADIALQHKNAAETAAASAVSVVQQDLSALTFDIPAGVVAITPIDAYEHGFVTWPVLGNQSWRSEARSTGAYLGVAANETAARAISGAADGDHYWNSADKKVYELAVTSGQTEVFRAGSANFPTGFALAIGSYVYLLDTSSNKHIWRVEDLTGYTIQALMFVSGQLWIGTTAGVIVLDYATGETTIAVKYDTTTTPAIVNNTVNAVAATVLPNAPRPNGIPVPTIAVATDGGVSVIKDIGLPTEHVVDSAAADVEAVSFSADGSELTYVRADELRVIALSSLADGFTYDRRYNTGPNPSAFRPHPLSRSNGPLMTSSALVSQSSLGLSHLFENPSDPASGMVAYQADQFTTPPMFGDVKGAFLCEQGQAGTLVASELHPNGNSDFSSSDVSYINSTHGSASVVGGQLVATGGLTATYSDHILYCATEVDAWYCVSVDYISTDGNKFGMYLDGAYRLDQNGLEHGPRATGETYHFWFQATNVISNVDLFLWGDETETQTFDNWTIRKGTPDRNVNGKGLIINGSLTQDADGWVSGFTVNGNHLEQPHNPDFDFGAGDFYVAFEFKGTDPYGVIVDTQEVANNGMRLNLVGGTGLAKYQMILASDAITSPISSAIDSGDPVKGFYVRRGGIGHFYENGRLIHSDEQDDNVSGGKMVIGYRQNNNEQKYSGDIRRVVIGAGAPSAKQIEAMANWVGDRLEGTFKDMAFVAETGVLHVLTDQYHYEVDADGAVLKSTPNTETWLKLSASRDGVVRTS